MIVNRILDRLEEWIIACLIAAATIVTFVAVVHRYGSSNSAALAAWANAHGLGSALGVWTGIHVGVDVLVNRLTPAARRPVIIFALLCGAAFTGARGQDFPEFRRERDRRHSPYRR
jgi:TRAP-type C4-dicarboxylate transport system permease small subunit